LYPNDFFATAHAQISMRAHVVLVDCLKRNLMPLPKSCYAKGERFYKDKFHSYAHAISNNKGESS